ncbi:hypothetical protein FHS61_001740 [Altererythrobacter atlanticus]|uniref:Inner membrane protein YqiJ n=1 Tax=Croceibacterium atlanticum TaxID=1267766 RepID=A0A0F7KKW6_9SPHN|nr:YqiJ family protein [Croceibacterium atlanticum]AKH41213.1 Inner membrane protein YqiJ [Croceibacterium atlanticum]MBB5732731.1 hypothetical protein [Croceibacterium atlanticum]
MSLLADHNLPFAVALMLMVMLAILQAAGLGDLFGESDVGVDPDMDADGDAGVSGGLLSILGIGRVPFLIWLAVALLVFAAIGVSIQGVAHNLAYGPLDRWLAAVLAGAAALPVTGALVRPLARILPADETSAVDLNSLVGRRGIILNGRAAAGYPARARIHDRHGHPHHVMVEPHEPAAELREGEQVLVVRRDKEIFYCVALEDRRLEPER